MQLSRGTKCQQLYILNSCSFRILIFAPIHNFEKGPFTVFAPVNDAFEVVDVEKLLQDEWRAHLQSLLLYHVVEGKIMSTDLSLDLAATTVEGSDVTVTSYPDPVMINDATVVQADIEATNGVIHVIDNILLPK